MSYILCFAAGVAAVDLLARILRWHRSRHHRRCAICQRGLHESPTNRWWTTTGDGGAVCFDCILRYSRLVLTSLERDLDEKPQ